MHLLENVHQNISATAIRDAVVAKRPLTKFVDSAVADYIKKIGFISEQVVVGHWSLVIGRWSSAVLLHVGRFKIQSAIVS